MRNAQNSSLHYRNCNLCEAICGIEISVQADQRLNIRGDKDDVLSRGYICPKAVALQDIHYHKDRLKYPVRRTPHGWQRIGWIGVDLFFVLSGFLITSILLQEFRERGSIHLGYFYMRRALRLLPALFSIIAFVIAFTWITHSLDLPITLWNAIGAMGYFYNWQIVVAPFPDYLGGRWMFTHLWSLSIEEQFYTTWPLIVLLLWRFRAP